MPSFIKDMMGIGMPAGQAAAVNGSFQANQTALGASQGTAFALTAGATEFTTVAASTGAILPPTTSRVVSTDTLAVYNQGANALSVYPPVGFKIGLTATNGAISVPSGKSAFFIARGDGNYFAIVSA